MVPGHRSVLVGRRAEVRTVGAALIVGGVTVGVVALVVLHVAPTGLSPLRNAVSQYGISPYRTGYRVQTIAFGVAGAGAAVGLASLPGAASVLVALCAVFAGARLSISWFPMDTPGTTLTTTGRRHGLLAICAFGAVGVAAEELSRLLTRDGIDAGYATASGTLAVLMLVSFIAMGTARRAGGGYFGVIERGFYACMSAWLVLVAALLLTTAT